ncbi:MAG TPA: hypothetical protein EYP98_21145, partial [Planctomycetes bacterium]|nr:hypothetical protein [Planctomycetota bacterium]
MKSTLALSTGLFLTLACVAGERAQPHVYTYSLSDESREALSEDAGIQAELLALLAERFGTPTSPQLAPRTKKKPSPTACATHHGEAEPTA